MLFNSILQLLVELVGHKFLPVGKEFYDTFKRNYIMLIYSS